METEEEKSRHGLAHSALRDEGEVGKGEPHTESMRRRTTSSSMTNAAAGSRGGTGSGLQFTLGSLPLVSVPFDKIV